MKSLPQVYAGEGDLQIIADNVWRIILGANEPPKLYRNSDRVVWIEHDDHGMPVMREVTHARLKHHLARIARFYKFNKKRKPVNARPPDDLPADLLARPDKSALPHLRRVTSIPLYGKDGLLHSTPGYNAATGLYYSPHGLEGLFPVAEQPLPEDIDLSRELIRELLCDFPFISPAEFAHAVGAVVQPFVRLMITGPTPLYLIEKPTPATGGTLLAHVISYPALGRFPSAVTPPREEAEWRRALLSWLRDCPTVVLIDNLSGILGSAALASALTDDTFRDRVVGTSDALSVPVECLWIATGNNPALSAEHARRCVRIRLDARVEHPDLRRNFRNPDLREWVMEMRAVLVWAILTLIQAWIAAGRPRGEIRLGGFESWSEVIGGVLKVAEIEGFLANRCEHRRMSERDTPQLAAFLSTWWGRLGDAKVGVAELWEMAADLDLGNGGDHSRRIRLGYLLDSLRDRRLGNYRVVKLGLYQGTQRYQLQPVPGGSAE